MPGQGEITDARIPDHGDGRQTRQGDRRFVAQSRRWGCGERNRNSAEAAEVGWLEADFVNPFFEYWHGEALSITGGDCSFLMS